MILGVDYSSCTDVATRYLMLGNQRMFTEFRISQLGFMGLGLSLAEGCKVHDFRVEN